MSTRTAERQPKTLAEAIRLGRKNLGMTQSEFARKLETSETNVWNWEHGRHEPSIKMFERIAAVLGWQLPYRATARYLGRAEWPSLDETPALAAVVG